MLSLRVTYVLSYVKPELLGLFLTSTLENNIGLFSASTLENNIGLLSASTLENNIGLFSASTLENNIGLFSASTLENNIGLFVTSTLENNKIIRCSQTKLYTEEVINNKIKLLHSFEDEHGLDLFLQRNSMQWSFNV